MNWYEKNIRFHIVLYIYSVSHFFHPFFFHMFLRIYCFMERRYFIAACQHDNIHAKKEEKKGKKKYKHITMSQGLHRADQCITQRLYWSPDQCHFFTWFGQCQRVWERVPFSDLAISFSLQGKDSLLSGRGPEEVVFFSEGLTSCSLCLSLWLNYNDAWDWKLIGGDKRSTSLLCVYKHTHTHTRA